MQWILGEYLKEDYVHKTISILERELNKDLGELVFEAVGTKINNEKFAESSVKYSEKGIVVDIMKGDIWWNTEKKPVVIEAWEFTKKALERTDSWLRGEKREYLHLVSQYGGEVLYIEIDTLEGRMRADLGDFIIQGVNGELYPCKPDIFEQTYEKP